MYNVSKTTINAIIYEVLETKPNESGHRTKKVGSTSQFKGISFLKKKNRWLAQIGIEDKKQHYIGTFRTELEAAQAYDQYIIENKLSIPLNLPASNPALH